MMENNNLRGAMLGVALSNAMNDQVFRNVLGYALLQNEKKLDDGIGMALIANDSNPFRDVNKMLVQPPTLGNIYRS